MGKIIETIIDRFDGGIENDPRDSRENTCRLVTNFDLLSSPRKLIPYRSSESGDSDPTNHRMENFAIGRLTSTGSWELFALGAVTGATGRAEIFYKDLNTSGTHNLANNTWYVPSLQQGAATGNADRELFVWYDKTGLFYGARNGSHIWTADPVSVTFTDAAQAVTYTTVAQGLVHSKDDILYIPYDNKILKNDNGSYTVAALTIPTHLRITSICEYGNFLAIGAVPKSGVGNSRVYLWDRQATLATVSESVDWGNGLLAILETVDGVLVGVSQYGGENTLSQSQTDSLVPVNGSSSFSDRVIFRVLSGNIAIKVKEIVGGTGSNANSTIIPVAKQVRDNRVHFMMSILMNGARREGVWSFGRGLSGGWTLAHERTPNNDTALSASDDVISFFYVEDYLFQAYLSGSSNAVSKTNDSALFNHTSIYESKVFNLDDSSLKKKLLGISVFTEPLAAGSQVVLKYAVDDTIGDASWTTILTHDTDDAVSDSAINIESSGAALPEFKEIQFRIEVTSGASGTSPTEITGFSFKSEVTGKRNYE